MIVLKLGMERKNDSLRVIKTRIPRWHSHQQWQLPIILHHPGWEKSEKSEE
jgi:hypothetical protein